MQKLLSLAAIAAGIALIYVGYQREHSLAGGADGTLSRIGEKIDGGVRPPTYVKYYLAGAAFLVAGAVGTGLVRK